MAKKVTITFDVPAELHQRAVKFSDKTQRSLSGTCRWALMQYLNSEEARQELEATSK